MPKYVLIVEDEEFLASLYKINLENRGVDIGIASNGKIALDMIKERVPDIVLMDLLMPEMDGFDFIQTVRSLGYTFPLVVMTNLSQEIDQKKCFDLGAQEYLVKSEMRAKDVWNHIQKYFSESPTVPAVSPPVADPPLDAGTNATTV